MADTSAPYSPLDSILPPTPPPDVPNQAGVVASPDAPMNFDPNYVLSAPTPGEAQTRASTLQNFLDQQYVKPQGEIMKRQADVYGAIGAATKASVDQNAGDNARLQTALDKRKQIESLPPIVTNILGLFDQDYNWNVQNEEVRGAKTNLAARQDYINNLLELGRISEAQTNARVNLLKTQREIAELPITRALNANAESFKNNMDLENQLIAKQSLAVQQGHLALARRQDARAEEQQGWARADRTVVNMSNDDLNAVSTGAKQMPGITPFQAHYQLMQRQKYDLDMKNLDLAVQSNIITVDEAQRQFAKSTLNDMTFAQLDELYKKAAASPDKKISFVSAHGAKYDITQQQIIQVMPAARAALGTIAALSAGQDQAKIEQAVSEVHINTSLNNLANVMAPNVPNMQNFTKTLQLHDAARAAEIQAAQKVAGITGDYSQVIALSKARRELFDKEIDDVIPKIYPEGQREFVQSMAKGLPASADSTAKFIGNGIFDPNFLIGSEADARYQPVAQAITAKMKEIARKDYGILIKGDSDIKQTMAQLADYRDQNLAQQLYYRALGDIRTDADVSSNRYGKDASVPVPAAQLYAGRMYSDALEQSWMRLKATNPNFANAMGDPMHSPKYRMPGGGFDAVSFASDLDGAWQKDVAQGKIPMPPGADAHPLTYRQQFIKMMLDPAFQQALAKRWTDGLSMNGQAFATSLHKGNVLFGYSSSVRGLDAQVNAYQAKMQAEATRAAAAAATSQPFMPPGGTGATIPLPRPDVVPGTNLPIKRPLQ